jgi:hypothetical protein
MQIFTEPSEAKTMNVVDNNDAEQKVVDIEIYGDDIWTLISKASSKKQGWMKSTKAMEAGDGVVMQVTTQQGDNVAEALTFIPNVKISKNTITGNYSIISK